MPICVLCIFLGFIGPWAQTSHSPDGLHPASAIDGNGHFSMYTAPNSRWEARWPGDGDTEA
ncbi:hypothetical protein PGT21_018467 [Puccinia graminis f. sp. tritici]|uniref:Uncharacterized protein n=1 Tax=Puccinia graminis f. sp. tritici TaxID=56615 RepID=A0A5B0NXW6_PUCGR|nr:hypothetical protein PGT21_018467 [Puccinia graminis f. sp. tritici]KAA1093364.1 hypothetical protein PGTUg99_025908 [Puccinia graminis f. sp. tritici]